jgi:hypothetical protein
MTEFHRMNRNSRAVMITPPLLSLTISPLVLLAGDLNPCGRISRETLFKVCRKFNNYMFFIIL